MSQEKKAFRVLLPIAFGGIKDIGEIVYMTQADAENIGIGKRLEAMETTNTNVETVETKVENTEVVENTTTENTTETEVTTETENTNGTDEATVENTENSSTATE